MGNKLGRRRGVVEEKYTRPQGLYEHRDIDMKKLRKLILESKLAPCYPGHDCDSRPLHFDLEECPICFLFYPSLNRSKCCSKGICTECFLQMKPTHATRPTQCPFCKTPNYAVEYRGVKTKEEKNIEQVEEQRVIEAQIRIRQQELQDEEERMKRKLDNKCSSSAVAPVEVEHREICNFSDSAPSFRCTTQGNELLSYQSSCSIPGSTRPSHARHNRDFNVHLDVEELMIMESKWRSMQEPTNVGYPTRGGAMLAGPSCPERFNCHPLHPIVLPPHCSFPCTLSSLSAHHALGSNYSHISANPSPDFGMLQCPGSVTVVNNYVIGNISPDSWVGLSPDCNRMEEEEVESSGDQWSEIAEASTSCAGSEVMVDPVLPHMALPEGFHMGTGHLLPESLEDQMMLSMTVPLAEACGRTWL